MHKKLKKLLKEAEEILGKEFTEITEVDENVVIAKRVDQKGKRKFQTTVILDKSKHQRNISITPIK